MQIKALLCSAYTSQQGELWVPHSSNLKHLWPQAGVIGRGWGWRKGGGKVLKAFLWVTSRPLAVSELLQSPPFASSREEKLITNIVIRKKWSDGHTILSTASRTWKQPRSASQHHHHYWLVIITVTFMVINSTKGKRLISEEVENKTREGNFTTAPKISASWSQWESIDKPG